VQSKVVVVEEAGTREWCVLVFVSMCAAWSWLLGDARGRAHAESLVCVVVSQTPAIHG
jgi:hypothetical protein